jgi:hypothetical protein
MLISHTLRRLPPSLAPANPAEPRRAPARDRLGRRNRPWIRFRIGFRFRPWSRSGLGYRWRVGERLRSRVDPRSLPVLGNLADPREPHGHPAGLVCAAHFWVGACISTSRLPAAAPTPPPPAILPAAPETPRTRNRDAPEALSTAGSAAPVTPSVRETPHTTPQ